MMSNKLLKFTIKILSFTLILAFIYVGLTAYALAYEFPDYVKVGLRYGNTAVNFASIDGEKGLKSGMIEGTAFIQSSDLKGNKSVSAQVVDGRILIEDLNGNIIESVEANTIYCLMASDSEEGGILKFNNAPYRGGIVLQINSEGKITVINRLGVEAYLYGVLNQEMSQSSPLEALKAQAIAARNFIAIRMGTHEKDGFDVCTTTHCQVYKGFGGEYPKTNQAVDETAYLMMFSQGIPVQAYYHKNSGGHTENSENVWYTTLPYLRGVLDPYSPIYPWSANLSKDNIQSLLSAGGYDIGAVQEVLIKRKTQAGSVLNLEIKGEQGNVLLEKEKIRSVLGFTVIKSLNFQMTNSNEKILSLQSSDKLESATGEISILSAEGSSKQVSIMDIYATNGVDLIKMQNDGIPQDDFTFSGFGYGHRLGMSQDGAIVMANQGMGFEKILKFYYENIEIR